ncbi:MAG: hypothetical protein J6A25_00540 [Lachnospiraceae bacterium]|nr:hypothetical protein [Lachnospiraceae bacterium]
MDEEKNDLVVVDENTDLSILTDPEKVAEARKVLNAESLALIAQIVDEQNLERTKDLTHLFNVNQNKKTMIRVNKLSDLMDVITDQAVARFTNRPDEISNQDLMNSLKTVQDLIERGTKQASGVQDTPLIQINQQTNEVNVGDTGINLGRDSRERVKNAVSALLSNLLAQQQATDDVVYTDVEDKTEEDNPDDI